MSFGPVGAPTDPTIFTAFINTTLPATFVAMLVGGVVAVAVRDEYYADKPIIATFYCYGGHVFETRFDTLEDLTAIVDQFGLKYDREFPTTRPVGTQSNAPTFDLPPGGGTGGGGI